jgi:hypothetical protein
MHTPTGIVLGDLSLGALAAVVPNWSSAYDDPTYRVPVGGLGIPGHLSGPAAGPILIGELA